LVSRYFHDTGIVVQHILKDAKLASHETLEKEMINTFMHSKKYHLPEIDRMFGTYTEEDQRRDAYRLKNKEIGYKQQSELIEID
jgi:coproporphyrinogen III oxidase-like Fe-S oxidoreductase